MTGLRNIPRILLAGGGTGGHVYPALAIAEAIRRTAPASAIAFIGTTNHLEWHAVPDAGFEIHPITISGLQRGRLGANVTLPLKVLNAIRKSLTLVRAFDPDVVVGTGGYVSLPVLAAAALNRRRVLIQEQNAFAGKANRWLAPRAAEVHVAFPEACKAFPRDKCRLTGNPVRSLSGMRKDDARARLEIPEDARVVLVMGGSGGSAAINAAMVDAASSLLEAEPALYILWQTGPRYHAAVLGAMSANDRLRLYPYIDAMDVVYAATDLALCRSGAITCSELQLTGTPSILIPSPNVAEDHQTHNAMSMVDAGAAALLPETDLRERMTARVSALLRDPGHLAEMSQAARRLARPNAADAIAAAVLALANQAGSREEVIESLT